MRKFLIFLLVLIPFLAQLVVIPWVNHTQPMVWGLPFLHFWLLLWMILTPVFTYLVYLIQKAVGSLE